MTRFALPAVTVALVVGTGCTAPPVTPGGPKEVRGQRIPEREVLMDCFAMVKGDEVRWRFSSDVPVAFRLEFREGAALVVPVERGPATADEGSFRALGTHATCLQWETGVQGATLDYRIELRRPAR